MREENLAPDDPRRSGPTCVTGRRYPAAYPPSPHTGRRNIISRGNSGQSQKLAGCREAGQTFLLSSGSLSPAISGMAASGERDFGDDLRCGVGNPAEQSAAAAALRGYNRKDQCGIRKLAQWSGRPAGIPPSRHPTVIARRGLALARFFWKMIGNQGEQFILHSWASRKQSGKQRIFPVTFQRLV